MPLGLLQIASSIYGKYDVKLIDQRVDRNWKKHLLKKLNENPLCVGITSITGKQISYALETSRYIKENSNVPIVWGGVHPTLESYSTIRNRFIDFVIEGEGEIAFCKLVDALSKNKNLKKVEGIWFKKKNQIRKGPKRKLINMDQILPLPYGLINVKDYLRGKKEEKRFLLETSRGCPNNCIFCSSNYLGQICWRSKSFGNVIKEINYIQDHFCGITNIELVDSNFFADYKRSKKILMEIKNRGFKLWIPGTEIYQLSDYIRNNDLPLLEESCSYMGLGVESGSNKVLRNIKKNITVNQAVYFNRKLKKYDITLNYNFMSGFPNESMTDLKMTVSLMLKLIKENKNSIAGPVNPLQLLPKTEIFENAILKGLKRPEKLEDWIKFDVSLKNKLNNLPWLNKKRKRLLKKIYLKSLFLNDQSAYMDSEIIRRSLSLFRSLNCLNLRKY
ncbi:MAG: radical SAM protein [Nanoarchaeota archaeon]